MQGLQLMTSVAKAVYDLKNETVSTFNLIGKEPEHFPLTIESHIVHVYITVNIKKDKTSVDVSMNF